MNLKNRIIAVVATAAIALPAVAIAKYSMKPNDDFKPKAYVSGKLSGGVGVEGTSHHVTLSDDDKNVKIKVKLDGIDTGIGDRNKHMKNKLFMNKFDAELVVKKDAVKGKKNGTVPGTLTMGGKTKDVSVSYSSKDVKDRVEVVGKTKINYRDFFGWEGKFKKESVNGKEVDRGEPACNFGICVKDDLDITVTLYVGKDE